RQTPYGGGRAVEVIARLLTAPPPSVAELRPDVPPGLDAVCRKAMAKEPAERYPSARELADALVPFTTPPSPDRPAAISAPPEKPKSRRWLIPAVVLAAAVVVAVVIALWPPRDDQAGTAPPTPPPAPQPPKQDVPAPKVGFDQAAERRAAEWVLGAGGKVTVVEPGSQ